MGLIQYLPNLGIYLNIKPESWIFLINDININEKTAQ